MSSATVNFALTNSSNANFRGWGKAISDQMVTSWTQAADTGQINWATVVAPAAINTVMGYEIWRSNDTGGGLNQLYVKLEYGSGGAINNPAVWVTVGWASDGAGNLTGIVITRKQITFTATATVSPMNLGVGTAWFCFAIGNVNNNSSLISVERTISNTGSFRNEVLFVFNNSGTWGSQVAEQSVIAYTAEASNGAITPTAANSLVNAVQGLSLVFGTKAGFTNPSLNVTACNAASLGGAQSTVSVTNYGAGHTYIINAAVASLGVAGASTVNLLSRFD